MKCMAAGETIILRYAEIGLIRPDPLKNKLETFEQYKAAGTGKGQGQGFLFSFYDQKADDRYGKSSHEKGS